MFLVEKFLHLRIFREFPERTLRSRDFLKILELWNFLLGFAEEHPGINPIIRSGPVATPLPPAMAGLTYYDNSAEKEEPVEDFTRPRAAPASRRDADAAPHAAPAPASRCSRLLDALRDGSACGVLRLDIWVLTEHVPSQAGLN